MQLGSHGALPWRGLVWSTLLGYKSKGAKAVLSGCGQLPSSPVLGFLGEGELLCGVPPYFPVNGFNVISGRNPIF